jgi:7-cyano-7-deazaguanine synthase in queuosine biosynthesis
MTSYQLRTERSQPADPAPTVLLDWFGNAGGSTIQYLGSLRSRLAVPAAALDLLNVAAAVFCVDRLEKRPGTWTRTIHLKLPVRQLALWNAVSSDFAGAVSFLSGDKWQLEFSETAEAVNAPAEIAPPVDAVCLFSGGLDSFTGAVNLLAEGKTVCLVGHYGPGQTHQAQEGLWSALARQYPDQVAARWFFLQPAAPAAGQARTVPAGREPSQRSRSLLFLAAGLTVAAGYGPDVPLYIPENGLIGINVPLTGARKGSFSTRTTHPYFMEKLSGCVQGLGITNPTVNPFRLMTKGEILTACADQQILQRLADATLSCAHPETARWAKEEQTNCGYCFPCLIRRASMHHVGLDRPEAYTYDVLADNPELAQDKGNDLRALVRSLNQPAKPTDVLRNGPVPAADIAAFADVYRRGRREILEWMEASATSGYLRRQLPA